MLHRKSPAGSAAFSGCGTWRYSLRRGAAPYVMFIGLNPSTADETLDDNTIRRCRGFARDWGYNGILMGNLFAYRSTDPKGLMVSDDPIGPANDEYLESLAAEAGLVVAAWGAYKLASPRARAVLPRLGEVFCLGCTKDGHPKHPLYLAKTTPLQSFVR